MSSQSRGGVSGTRLDSLTGLRFIAAAMVFVSHIPTTMFFSQNANILLFRLLDHLGSAAVSFFFILSGFVLTASRRQTDTAGLFIRRRLVKIFPNHIVTFILAGLAFFYAFTAARAIPNLLLLQAWIPRVDQFFSINPVAWSLSCELLFYLLFPILIRWIDRIRPEDLWYWVIGTGLAILGVWYLATTLVPGNPPLVFPPLPVGLYQYWVVYIFPPARLLEFILGILMAKVVLNGRWISVGILPFVWLVVAGFVVADQVPPLMAETAVLAVPLALLVAAAGWTDLNKARSILRNRRMVWLGEISFAFYMIHGVVLFGSRPLFGVTRIFSAPAGIGLILLNFVVSLLLAWALYALVERPMVRRFSNPRKRAPKPALAPTPVPETIQPAAPAAVDPTAPAPLDQAAHVAVPAATAAAREHVASTP